MLWEEGRIEGSDKNDDSTVNTGPRKKKTFKKAPDAPKRFKSAYICFVGDNMESAKRQLPYDVKVTDVMKKLAVDWKNLPASERERYERLAEADKSRYFQQMESYTGPMRVPNKRQKKPEGAPKRAMSAFLSFSQMMRPSIRAQQPTLKNTEISSVLADRWRSASEEEKRPHLEKELRDREKYHTDMLRWKEEEVVRGRSSDGAGRQLQPHQQLHSSLHMMDPEPSVADAFDVNTYATFLGVDNSVLEPDLLDYADDPELMGLIYDTGQQSPTISSGASESSRSQHTRGSNRSASADMPESELVIGPGMYARSNSSQSSHGSQSMGSGYPDMTPLQIYGFHQSGQLRASDPIGTYLRIPSTSMPAPGGRPTGSIDSRGGRSSFGSSTVRPPVSYWCDDVAPSAPSSAARVAEEAQQMFHAFTHDTALDERASKRKFEYGASGSVNQTLSAASRTNMYRMGQRQAVIPAGMSAMETSESNHQHHHRPVQPANSLHAASAESTVPADQSSGSVRRGRDARMQDLLRRQKEEQDAQEMRQAEEIRQLQQMESDESDAIIATTSSPSDEGNASPIQK